MLEELKSLQRATQSRDILQLFDGDRASDFSVSAGKLLFDYSKTNIDADQRQKMFDLCKAAALEERRDAMFAGVKINETEGRAVLHTALRNASGPVFVAETDVIEQIQVTLKRMGDLATDIRNQTFAAQGGAITDVVNIGIGGSDLGPAMATLALAPYHDGPKCHFVSNVDGAHITDTLAGLDPSTTLIIVASKTFTTIETLTNAETARRWMAAAVDDPGKQFVALSSAQDRTSAFGIPEAQVFGFEDWVGGRYSVWGPIGFSLMVAIGPERFKEFLAGAHDMDTHFCKAPLEQNMPVALALVGLWHHQISGYATRAVLPYDQRLARLPAYLQQLEMESNGKSVAMDGAPVPQPVGPIVWGEPGTNGQHAFYQLIHQGQQVVPCEFIIAREGHEPDLTHQHHLLQANCLAQSEALLRGRTLDEARSMLNGKFEEDELERQARHRVFSGNRPSTTLGIPKLTPFVLGQIIALYEHRVFVEGVLLGINSFDQWGVELGKELATALGPVMAGEAEATGKDPSTVQLVAYLRAR